MLFEVGLLLPFAGDCSCTCFLCPMLRISAVLLRPSTCICVTYHPTLSIKGAFLTQSVLILKFFKDRVFVNRFLTATREFSFFLTLLTGCTGHLPSFSGWKGRFSDGKVAGAWTWPLIYNYSKVKNEWSSKSTHAFYLRAIDLMDFWK